MDAALEALHISLVAQAREFVYQTVLQSQADLITARRALGVTITDTVGTTLSSVSLSHLVEHVTEIWIPDVRRLLVERLTTAIDTAVHLGASMVGNVLASLAVSYEIPPVADVLYAGEALADPTLDHVHLFFDNLQRELITLIHLAFLQRSSVGVILQTLQRLLPTEGYRQAHAYQWRLRVLIQTDVGRSISEGTQAILNYAALSVPGLAKRWYTTSAVSRHEAMQGVQVAANLMFSVFRRGASEAEWLHFPRDAAGSVDTTANCTCFMVPTL